MTTVKLFSQNRRTIGTTTTLPVVGVVTYSKDDNSIEIDADKVDALRARDFGVILLTTEEVEKKKNEEFLAQKQKHEAKKNLPSILVDQSKHPLQYCIAVLKEGRNKKDQDLIDEIIEIHFNEGKDDIEVKQNDFKIQLEGLEEKDLDELLSEYPKSAISKLKTKADKIDYLCKKK